MDTTNEKIAQINALIAGHSKALMNKEVSGFDVSKILESANKIAETITYHCQQDLDEAEKLRTSMDKGVAIAAPVPDVPF